MRVGQKPVRNSPVNTKVSEEGGGSPAGVSEGHLQPMKRSNIGVATQTVEKVCQLSNP